MKQKRPIVISLFTIFIAVFLFIGFFPYFYKQFDHKPQGVQYSPDQRFRIEYYAIPFLPFRPNLFNEMGSGIRMGCTDCPGYIRLVDNRNNRVLKEKYFATRHIVSNGIDWRENEVNMKLFVSWSLPEK